MSKIKLLVFDEGDEFRAPLEQYAHTVPKIQFLGVENEVEKAIDHHKSETPDIVLYASVLIKRHGTEPLQALRARWPKALYYRLTVFDDSGYDQFDYVKGFDGSVPRSRIEDHLNTIIETFSCHGTEPEPATNQS